ncbi:MerR family transcriptional regulator [Actinomadura sp. 6N118]|uniref:helix-turn-helix domain-containing protein n=1 Tax=Actinomadura sp. 6N118 TaxID=3375151 RepID=UPI0037B7F078
MTAIDDLIMPVTVPVNVHMKSSEGLAIGGQTDKALAISRQADETLAIGEPANEGLAISGQADEGLAIGEPANEGLAIGEQTHEGLAISGQADEGLAIGELAERFGLATHVLRHWESMGLLEPARLAGGQRSYGLADLGRVALILMGKEAGFTLAELRTLLSTASPMDHRDMLRRHVQELEQRIAQAQAAKKLIEHALACPYSFSECEHAREQIAARIPPAPGPDSADPQWHVKPLSPVDL